MRLDKHFRQTRLTSTFNVQDILSSLMSTLDLIRLDQKKIFKFGFSDGRKFFYAVFFYKKLLTNSTQ